MEQLDQILLAKKVAGISAARRVNDGSVVGLGTGVTSRFAIEELGRRVREEGLRIIGIPTSFDSASLARRCGIQVGSPDDVTRVEIAFDGADQVDAKKDLIKGGGAAHLREKVVDSMAEHFIVIVHESKLVNRLGETGPVPVEVVPFALNPVLERLRGLGGEPQLRMAMKKIGPVITEQGNLIVDVRFDEIADSALLEMAINNIPGVVENGLFVGLADVVMVGANGQSEAIIIE